MKKDKRKKRKRGHFLITFAVIMICGVVSYKRVTLEVEENKVRAAGEAVKRQYEKEQEREQELEELQIYTQTKRFIEDMAREKFGLVYENEIVFEPEED